MVEKLKNANNTKYLISFCITFSILFLYALKPDAYFVYYSSSYPYAPFYYRWIWKLAIFPLELFFSAKLSALLLTFCILFLVCYLSYQNKYLYFTSIILLFGNYKFFYLSDILVILFILLIIKYPDNPYLLISCFLKEDVALFYLFFSRSKNRFVAVPFMLLNRALFYHVPYANSNTALLQIVNIGYYDIMHILEGLSIILILFIIVFKDVNRKVFVATQSFVAYSILILIIVTLFGNFWEFNKFLGLYYYLLQPEETTTNDKIFNAI